jgi:DNA topoisomerase-3
MKVEFHWQRVRLFDQQAAQIFHDICLENPKAKVEQVQSKPKSKWRPLPMDTVVRIPFKRLSSGKQSKILNM